MLTAGRVGGHYFLVYQTTIGIYYRLTAVIWLQHNSLIRYSSTFFGIEKAIFLKLALIRTYNG